LAAGIFAAVMAIIVVEAQAQSYGCIAQRQTVLSKEGLLLDVCMTVKAERAIPRGSSQMAKRPGRKSGWPIIEIRIGNAELKSFGQELCEI